MQTGSRFEPVEPDLLPVHKTYRIWILPAFIAPYSCLISGLTGITCRFIPVFKTWLIRIIFMVTLLWWIYAISIAHI
ncbi:hypothetical protein HanIR_Chr15g0772191 [Helianthus annuus]|nr:hypothetical protein HanIR_Chr15g0772191 [Helianthus annuus]